MAFRDWMAGKKTYLLAGVILLVAAMLGLRDELTPETATFLLVVSVPGFAVTFRSALMRHHQEELMILEELAETGAAVAARNLPAAVEDVVKVAAAGERLVEECQQEQKGS